MGTSGPLTLLLTLILVLIILILSKQDVTSQGRDTVLQIEGKPEIQREGDIA